MNHFHTASRPFVLVGHCGPDAFMLRTAVERSAPGSEVCTVTDERQLKDHLDQDVVLLVNRVLDGRFHDSSGINLIRRLAVRTNPPRLVLVSNLADAQMEAELAGASPGFGKSALYDPATQVLLQQYAANMHEASTESSP